MCKEVRHFKLPIGKDGVDVTIGDLIDRTPKEYISKAMLEKVFDTWHSGWLMKLVIMKACKMRPQASFLPLVQDLGIEKPAKQPSLQKTLAILKKRATEEKTGPKVSMVVV